VSHPFCTLADTFRLLEHSLALAGDDPTFARLLDAYLEPWGAIMPPDRRGGYDEWLASLLLRGLMLAGV
jgi:hypothetical protein